MRIALPTPPRRGLGLALACLILGGGITAAASPSSDVGDFDFRFRDETGATAVLAIYPEGASPLRLRSLRIRGPKVGWLDEHPLAQGTVRWRLIVRSAPSRTGPWTVESRSTHRFIVADKVGPLEGFENRAIGWPRHDGQRFVRVTARLTWVNEDGGRLGWVRHEYTKYGLVVREGAGPRFGDEEATRASAPNLWRR